MENIDWTSTTILGAITAFTIYLGRSVWAWLKIDVWPVAKEQVVRVADSLVDTHQKLTDCSKANTKGIMSLSNDHGHFSEAGKAHCEFLRADVDLRKDLTQEDQAKLHTLIDRIEQGLTK